MKAARTVRSLAWIYSFDAHVDDDGADEGETIEVPEDLTEVSDEDLEALSTRIADFSAATLAEPATADRNAELRTLAAMRQRVSAESTRRSEERAQLDAEAAQLAAELGLADETTQTETPGNGDGGNAEGENENGDGENGDANNGGGDGAPAGGDGTQQAQAQRVPLSVRRRPLNVPLSEVQRRAPDPNLSVQREASVIVAPDVPNTPAGSNVPDLELLADAVHRRSKTLGNPSGYVSVATIKREFDITLDPEARPSAVMDVIRRSADPQNLVAAGGWCAPSAILYDFFNIACDDGIIDVPTIGITRGGLRWPTSASIQDVLANVWLWTENDDIAAVTGAGTKPCVRVPCPSFNEDRLDCHGICVTAGNLTEAAFPELIANHLKLTMSAHRHVMNQRFIADIVALSTSVALTGTGNAYSVGLLNGIALQAADYREKFRMCDDDILEVVLPRWSKEAIRADYAKRNGIDNPFDVTDQMILNWFDVRYVRVQFVSDWQLTSIGATGAAQTWPNQVQFLIYAAGTFVVGNGLDLDLGVVRDSTLNAKNDHTAAWTEECTLTAKIGHEGRIVTLNGCVSGESGAADGQCGL